MQSFKTYLELSGKSKSTINHYNTYLLDFLAYLDKDNTEIENCTAKEVLAYLNHLQNKGLENKTRAIRLNVIKQFFNYQIEQSRLSTNPIAHIKIRGIKSKKLYPILSTQELEMISHDYRVPEENDPRKNKNWFTTYSLSKARNKVILSLMINQGLTTAEVSQLSVTDLKLREGELHIKSTRTSNERNLKLKSNQIMDLMEYTYQVRDKFLSYQKSESKQLFLGVPTAGRDKVEADNSLQIWKGLTKEIKEAHPKFINFKQVRTSVITKWLKLYNLREVQYMAGHKYVSSTEAYLVNQTEDLQESIDKFHPF